MGKSKESDSVFSCLSKLDMSTIELMARGLTDSKIAKIQGVSLSAVKKRKSRIYRKMKMDFKSVRGEKRSLLLKLYQTMRGENS